MTMMAMMNVAVRTGPAISHDANPTNGMMDMRQATRMRIQLLFTRPLNPRAAWWTTICVCVGLSPIVVGHSLAGWHTDGDGAHTDGGGGWEMG